jgi:adenosylcobinamide-GDP ribazoletransferase
MMGGFLSAIQFLTIVPVKSKNADEKNLGLSLLYFPAVGLILGLVLICIYHLLVFLGFQPWAAAVILTVSLTLITGGLHLDGLADTLDALAGGRDREQMLQIMRDPHIGTMGVLGLLCAVLLKTVLVASLSAPALLKALPVMCVLSR